MLELQQLETNRENSSSNSMKYSILVIKITRLKGPRKNRHSRMCLLFNTRNNSGDKSSRANCKNILDVRYFSSRIPVFPVFPYPERSDPFPKFSFGLRAFRSLGVFSRLFGSWGNRRQPRRVKRRGWCATRQVERYLWDILPLFRFSDPYRTRYPVGWYGRQFDPGVFASTLMKIEVMMPGGVAEGRSPCEDTF